jgi:signal transduction histidine kinase
MKNEQLEELNYQLNQLNGKLQKSESDLKLANAQKDKFYSIIAHDLKGPFMGLMGLSDVMSNEINEISKEEIAEYSGLINSTSKKLFGLLTNLLDWSRVQTGKMEFEPQNLNLRSVASEAISLYEQSAVNKEISLINEVSNEMSAYADQNILSTLIRNLVSNALKFTNPGGMVKILSSVEDNMPVISVMDNGRGLSEESINKIFASGSSFTTKGSQGEIGTGLGLALCQELVAINGGNIYCKSKEGQGATFSFTIPQAK